MELISAFPIKKRKTLEFRSLNINPSTENLYFLYYLRYGYTLNGALMAGWKTQTTNFFWLWGEINMRDGYIR